MPARSVSALVALLLAAASAPLPAQLVRASAVRGWSSHELIGAPRGVDVRAALPAAGLLALFELGFTRLNSSTGGRGVPCAGLVEPGTCAEEPVRRDARLSVATASWSFPALRSGGLTLALTPEVGLGRVSGTVQGVESGRRIDASRWLYALGAGAAIRYRPLPVLPLQLQVGYHLQRLSKVNPGQVVDGYTPFDTPFIVRRLELGVSVGLPGALR